MIWFLNIIPFDLFWKYVLTLDRRLFNASRRLNFEGCFMQRRLFYAPILSESRHISVAFWIFIVNGCLDFVLGENWKYPCLWLRFGQPVIGTLPFHCIGCQSKKGFCCNCNLNPLWLVFEGFITFYLQVLHWIELCCCLLECYRRNLAHGVSISHF